MRIATRFSIAVHILSLLGTDLPQEPTSEFLAGSIGVNPVVVRNVIGMLKRAGLVLASQGRAGASLAKPLEEVSLLDVYRAVEVGDDLFAIHGNPHPECPVGRNIQGALDSVFTDAQRALENRLAATTLRDVLTDILAAASVDRRCST